LPGPVNTTEITPLRIKDIAGKKGRHRYRAKKRQILSAKYAALAGLFAGNR